jgi:trk/ktr system potassium uptake protein
MRVGIAGAGNVGLFIANDLHAAGHEVQLIEQNPAVVERAVADEGVEWFIADACEVSSLKEAGLERCDVVVAATGDDEDNLVTSLLAKQEFAVPRVLARVNHPGNEWLFNEQWGVDQAVSPPHILTAMVEEAVTAGDLVRLLRLEGGRASIVELKLTDSSPAAGKALYEMRLPPDSTIVAILREGHVVIPQPETVLAADDEIVALSAPESELTLRGAIVGEGPS